MERKYIGIPTQEEVIEQYNALKEIVKDVKTYEQIIELIKQHHVNVEINYDDLKSFKQDDDIEVIRYEYKNILVYHYMNKTNIDEYITVYSDDGFLQFADCLYYEFDAEVKRVAKMGLLQSIN